MQVRYTVTLADLVAYDLYFNRKSGVGRPGYLIIWLGPPILCAAGAVRALQHDHEPAAMLFAAIAVFGGDLLALHVPGRVGHPLRQGPHVIG